MVEQATAPDTPGTGQVVIYPNTDSALCTKNDAGTVSVLPALGAANTFTGANTFSATQTFSGLVVEGQVQPPGASMVTTNIQALSNFTSITNGILLVLDIEGTQYALFAVKGGSNAVQELLDPNNTFSATADTASSINVYYSSGYKIQNNRAYTTVVRVLGIGQ
jgi:hypothetical protein